jgi:NAD(P)H-hydrate epimerase
MDYNLPRRTEESYKGTYGRVLHIAGSDYMPGAAYLASLASLKIGCGYSVLCSTQKVIESVAAKTGCIVFAPLEKLEEQIELADVIAIGCGLSTEPQAVEIFKRFLKAVTPDKKIIIDADGLNILARKSEIFKEKGLNNVVITPHPKEASRLLGIETGLIVSDIKAYASRLAERYGCVAVLKTHNTVVSTNDGRIYTNTTGNNAMAKAGSGDVLTGMISGLISQGIGLYEASVLGVLLHGLSGDIARDNLTEYYVMAEDLITYIPEAIKSYRTTK